MIIPNLSMHNILGITQCSTAKATSLYITPSDFEGVKFNTSCVNCDSFKFTTYIVNFDSGKVERSCVNFGTVKFNPSCVNFDFVNINTQSVNFDCDKFNTSSVNFNSVKINKSSINFDNVFNLLPISTHPVPIYGDLKITPYKHIVGPTISKVPNFTPLNVTNLE